MKRSSYYYLASRQNVLLCLMFFAGANVCGVWGVAAARSNSVLGAAVLAVAAVITCVIAYTHAREAARMFHKAEQAHTYELRNTIRPRI